MIWFTKKSTIFSSKYCKIIQILSLSIGIRGDFPIIQGHGSCLFPWTYRLIYNTFFMYVSWFVKNNDIDFTGICMNSQKDYVPIHVHIKETHYKKVMYRKILQLYLSMCLPFQILAQNLWCQFHLLIRQNTSIFTHLHNNIYMSAIYHIIWEQYTRQNALAVIHKFRRKGPTWLKTKVGCGVWLWNTSC